MSEIPDDIYKIRNTPAKANGKKVLVITDDKTEDLEFFYPYYRFAEEGYAVDVATPDGGEFKGKHGLPLSESRKLSDIDPSAYDLLYIPGGEAPASLRENNEVLDLTRRFVETGRPVTSVCHGPQILAAAGVIDGRKIAAWPECEEDVEEAGATFTNEQTVVDGQFITGRWPADLPSLVSKTFEIMQTR